MPPPWVTTDPSGGDSIMNPSKQMRALQAVSLAVQMITLGLARFADDTRGDVGTRDWIQGFIGILVVTVVFFALIGTILTQIANTTLTGASLALVNLLPVLLAIALVLLVVAFALRAYSG
jgi:uncharacterized membrane protein